VLALIFGNKILISSEFRVQDLGIKVQGSGFGVQGPGFSSGFRVLVHDLWFMVYGSGFRV